MSSGAQQLKNDFEEVGKLLESYPDIKVVKTEGDPPEQYDIEYTIKGYKTNPDGTPSPENRHLVRITLPFGYPHFPPTAKPLTPIFHPDIDPDAIRIADFWKENHSLADLIIHIGQMICGNHYTKEEPFNQTAYDWFEERSSWLPFDVLEPREDEDETDEETGGKTGETFVPATDLDILKDDLDFPFDEDDESEEISEDLDFEITEDTSELDLIFEEEDKPVEDILFETEDAEEEEIDFSIESEEDGEDVSLDLTGEDEQPAGLSADSLFDLETEEDSPQSPEELFPEQDSDDFTSAFEEEPLDEQEQSTELDITLDDLGELEEEEQTFDFGTDEETFAASDSGVADLSALEDEEEPDFLVQEDEETVDLSGLEQTEDEVEEEPSTPQQDETDEEDVFSSLSLDEEFSSAQKAEDQAQIIQTLIEKKQIFSAKKLLNDLPDPETLPKYKQLELTINDAVSEAEDLYKQADLREQKGDFEKAGVLLDLAANIAADYPALDFARNRIRESMMDREKDKASAAPEEEKVDQTTEDGKPTDKKTKKKKKATRRGLKIPARLVALLVLLLLIVGIGGGSYYVYENDASAAHDAGTAVKQAEQMVEGKQFKDAQQKLESARTALDKIIFFKGGKKVELENKINAIAGSDFFKEGIKGRVLYGDTYVSVETARAIDKFTSNKNYAEQLLTEGKIEQAISAYEKSLPYAEQAGFTEEVADISHQIKELQLQEIMDRAGQAEEQQDWQSAEKAYHDAVELSKEISPPEEQQNIARSLATASYRLHLHEGLEAISNSRWQQSITALQQVLEVLEENPQLVPTANQTEIKRMLLESQLYARLAEAKKAYENRKWQEAITLYKKAVVLLQDNNELFGEETAENISKIEKTILNTKVAEEQFYVAAAQSQKELEEAVRHYEAIVGLIEGSQYRDDPTLAKILEDAQTRAAELKNELLIMDKKNWLLANYDQIFRDAYPSAKMSDLMNPKVRFIKREGDILIFNLSCSERKQGRMFRLELNYQHDLTNNDWSIYTEKIEEET